MISSLSLVFHNNFVIHQFLQLHWKFQVKVALEQTRKTIIQIEKLFIFRQEQQCLHKLAMEFHCLGVPHCERTQNDCRAFPHSSENCGWMSFELGNENEHEICINNYAKHARMEIKTSASTEAKQISLISVKIPRRRINYSRQTRNSSCWWLIEISHSLSNFFFR